MSKLRTAAFACLVVAFFLQGCGTEKDAGPPVDHHPATKDAGTDVLARPDVSVGSPDASADTGAEARPPDEGGQGEETGPDDSSTGRMDVTNVPPDAGLEASSDASSRRPFDWVGIIGTGQSLGIGARGLPVISGTQPYHNLKLLDMGPDPKYAIDGGGPFSLVPLVEPIRPPLLVGYPDGGALVNQYPTNIRGESPHSGMANQLSALSLAETQRDYVTLHTVVGWGGKKIELIDKSDAGYLAYPGSLAEGRAFVALAKAAGKSFGYGAILLTHGESDAENKNYGAQVRQLWADYNADLKRLTGQTTDIPLLVSQQSVDPLGPAQPLSSLAVWKLGVDNPGKMICIGPKYQYAYASDLIHLDAPGYVRLGQKYAQVYYEVVVRGKPWHPLQPKAARRAANKITVDFEVPVPPLNWDLNMKSPHQTLNTAWAKGKGFEAEDSTGPLTITSVSIVGSTVEITLGAPPAGTGLVVRYAVTQDGAADAGNQGGTAEGHIGLLRDSDPFTGYDLETISCNVVTGSTTVTSMAANGFARRAGTDDVTGPGVPADTVIATKVSDSEIKLSKPWPGASGTAPLTMRYDHRNYAVHFELPVP